MLQDRSIAIVVTETTIFALVMIISFLGNFLVCCAVYRNPRLRNPSNYYIISLALTDILQASCSMPLSVARFATGEWSFGAVACELNSVLKLSLTRVSAFNMALMALNRYYKVVKPNKYQAIFKSRNVVTTALLAWIIPMAFVIPSVIVGDQNAKSSLGLAMCDVQFAKSFYPAVFGTMYSPYFIIVFCYWKIYRKVKMHNGNLSWQTANVAEVKVSKTLFVTVVSFFVLLSPAHIILTFARLAGDEKEHVKKSTVALLLIFMTSCTNPFIYGYMNRSFRSEFKKCLMLKRGHAVALSGAGQNCRYCDRCNRGHN